MSLIAIKNNEKTLIIFDSILSLIIIIVLSVFYKKIVKKKKQAIFKSLLLAIGMFLFSIILNLLFSRIPTPENQHYINEVRNVAPVLMALHTRLFSPILEELLTRGIFMNLFFIKNTSRSVLCKIFFSGLFFGLSHGLLPSISMLFYCGMGWVLASTYYFCNNNLTYPLAIHLLLNNLWYTKKTAHIRKMMWAVFCNYLFFVSNNGLTGLFSWIRLIASPINSPTLTSSILAILRSSDR